MLASVLFQIVAYLVGAAQCVDFVAHVLTNRAILSCLVSFLSMLPDFVKAALGM